MAHKMKVTLTRVEREKIKWANAKRVREVRKREQKEKEDQGKDVEGKEQKEDGVVKKMRRGIKALKEIKK